MIGGNLCSKVQGFQIPWEFFVQEFKAKYVTDMYRESKWKRFLNMKQRNLSMVEYEK